MELDAALARLGMRDPVVLTETGAARLWRVTGADGTAQVLKLYKRGQAGNESAGAALMAAWHASGAPVVRMRHWTDEAWVMDWVEGPLLGDTARSGRVKEADHRLSITARRLHRTRIAREPALPALDDWFTALFDLRFGPDCAPDLRQDMQHAARIARHLLDTQTELRPLHGDLHHDNVICGADLVAIDAKGVLGERAYELANAMRNPNGCEAEMRDPTVIRWRVARFAQALDADPERLARWAVAKSALSIAWRAKGCLDGPDEDADLLSVLRATLAPHA